MIIVGTPNDYNFLENRCDGRCVDGEWCVLGDGKNRINCPIYNNDNFIVVVKNRKHDGLEVE